MSDLVGLGEATFLVDAGVLPHKRRFHGLSFFICDPTALAVAATLLDALRAKGYRPSSPGPAGKFSAGFSCNMSAGMAGISVQILEFSTNDRPTEVGLLVRQIQPAVEGNIDVIDPGWPELAGHLREAIVHRYGTIADFQWDESIQGPLEM